MLNIRKSLLMFIALIFICCSPSNDTKSQDIPDLPGPQLVTGAWMFIAAYKTDPEVLKKLLPPGLEPHPNNHIVINMYTVPNPTQTSGFGAYTLTYLTVEVNGQDSYVMGQDTGFPGRSFAYYYNSSPTMRNFTTNAGIPAQEGVTTTTVAHGKLTAQLKVDDKVYIQATADVGNDLGGFGGGHLNYFGYIKGMEKGGKKVNQTVKYPIPWNGGVVETTNPKIEIKAPEGHPLHKVKPLADPTWAVWMKGSFVYPQYQVIHESPAG